jgi:hypothetical protein
MSPAAHQRQSAPCGDEEVRLGGPSAEVVITEGDAPGG